MDTYLIQENVYNRLVREYEAHNQLIIAYDFDNTVFDYHNKGETYNKVIELLRKCKELGFYLIVYSCSPKSRYSQMIKYLKDNNIPFDTINENSPKIKFAEGKLYYNILLDDRAGLSSSYEVLSKLIKNIEIKGRENYEN